MVTKINTTNVGRIVAIELEGLIPEESRNLFGESCSRKSAGNQWEINGNQWEISMFE
jgi:hypothetical protein